MHYPISILMETLNIFKLWTANSNLWRYWISAPTADVSKPLALGPILKAPLPSLFLAPTTTAGSIVPTPSGPSKQSYHCCLTYCSCRWYFTWGSKTILQPPPFSFCIQELYNHNRIWSFGFLAERSQANNYCLGVDKKERQAHQSQQERKIFKPPSWAVLPIILLIFSSFLFP